MAPRNARYPSGEREPPVMRVLKTLFFGGVPVTAVVTRPEIEKSYEI